ncbi:MAG: hypothetical protein IPQ09_03870 [Myxococcales bacterium]|nr:hypothetical protein [Myxococcales bacterium]
MSVPTYDTFIGPLLKHLADRSRASSGAMIPDTYEALADGAGLSEDDRAEMLPSGAQAVYKNRIGWAHDRLKRAGLSGSPRRGVWQLTAAGLALAKKYERLPATEVERIASADRTSRVKSRNAEAAEDESPTTSVTVATAPPSTPTVLAPPPRESPEERIEAEDIPSRARARRRSGWAPGALRSTRSACLNPMVRATKAPAILPWRMMQEVRTRDKGWAPSTAQLAWCGRVQLLRTSLSIELELVFDWRCRHLIFINSRPSTASALLLDTLRTAGFDISDGSASRELPHSRALDAEIAWIQRTSRRHGELLAPPARRPKLGKPALASATARCPFRRAAFTRAALVPGWNTMHAFAGRTSARPMLGLEGWRVQAFCSASVDEDGERLELLVILYATERPTKREASRASARLSATLAPLGFEGGARRSNNGWWGFFQKPCATLQEARRDRRRLDRVLFAR